MTLSDLEQQRRAAHDAFNQAQADMQRLTTESMVAMKTWLDAQQIAERAYQALTKTQTDHVKAFMALNAAKFQMIALVEQVHIELVRKSAQA